jgi:hypothetical protein
MKFIDAADVVTFSALSAEQVYKAMTTSAEIIHGYRRYGPTYIDRRFINLYTTLQQIYLWLNNKLKFQFSSRESIGKCLEQLEAQQPTDASLDKYYQNVNQNLAQAFAALPKLQAYIIWRNQQG